MLFVSTAILGRIVDDLGEVLEELKMRAKEYANRASIDFSELMVQC